MGFAQFDMGLWGGGGMFMLSGVGVAFLGSILFSEMQSIKGEDYMVRVASHRSPQPTRQSHGISQFLNDAAEICTGRPQNSCRLKPSSSCSVLVILLVFFVLVVSLLVVLVL